MAVKIADFLGQELNIPEDLNYELGEGLWIFRGNDGTAHIGLTQPTVLMSGAVREVEILVEDGSTTSPGQTVALVLTSKLKYLAVPFSGRLMHPSDVGNLPEKINTDPYRTALFHLIPEQQELPGLLDAEGYAACLRDSEGSRNPHGHKGGVSPTCKAVYMEISQQNLRPRDQLTVQLRE